MVRAVGCAECGKRFLVADAFEGPVVCPYCGREPGARHAPAARLPPAPAPAVPGPAKRGRKRKRKTGPPAGTALARAAHQAWERVPERQRRARRWPPPRNGRAASSAPSRRDRAERRTLRPFLILLVVLAALLVVFALLALRYGRVPGEPSVNGLQPVAEDVRTAAVGRCERNAATAGTFPAATRHGFSAKRVLLTGRRSI